MYFKHSLKYFSHQIFEANIEQEIRSYNLYFVNTSFQLVTVGKKPVLWNLANTKKHEIIILDKSYMFIEELNNWRKAHKTGLNHLNNS